MITLKASLAATESELQDRKAKWLGIDKHEKGGDFWWLTSTALFTNLHFLRFNLETVLK